MLLRIKELCQLHLCWHLLLSNDGWSFTSNQVHFTSFVVTYCWHWDWSNPIWKYFVHDHHSSFSHNGWCKHYLPSCCFQGKLIKDGRFSTYHLTGDLSFSPRRVVCFHLPFFSVFSQGLLMPWTFKPTFRNGFNILSIRMMPDIRSGGNECFSGPNRFLPDLSVVPTCLGISGPYQVGHRNENGWKI